MHALVAQLAELFHAGPIAVLTGAGLSTASGIPAYRDPAGRWQHATPVQHRDFLRSDAVRRRYWARSFFGWPMMANATPNRGHSALAALARRGHLASVITQNVDGLHQRAGSDTVIELHGSIDRVRCLGCDATHARADMQDWLAAANPNLARHQGRAGSRRAPDGDFLFDTNPGDGLAVPACPACGAVLKPDVVFFGDSVPRDRVALAMQAVADTPALLVVGSSLMVWSGYRFAESAHRLGKPVVAINLGITRADALLRFKIKADCGLVLGAVCDALERTNKRENQS